jgi:HemY protein
MLRLIIFLIIAAALAVVAVWFANNPGQVIVSLEQTEMVFPIGIAVAIMAAITAAGVVLYEIWRWIVGLPRQIRIQREQNRRIRGYQELTHGLIAAAAGDVSGARVHSKQAEKLLQSNAATLLLSAQTAQLEGKEDVAQFKFQQMLKRPQTEFLGVRGLLADAVKRGDQDEALALAERAYAQSPNTSWVLTTYFDLLTRNGKWAKAVDVIGDMAREKLLSGPEATRRRALMKYMIASDALEAGNDKLALDMGRTASGLAPTFAPAAITAAEAAKRLGKLRAAKRLIEDCWTLEPQPDLARAYADLVPGETAVERLRRCGRLEKLRPGHLVTEMVMAELAMNARHWDTAKQHLDRALSAGPTAGTYRLYAEYERASGGGDAKARDWLAKAADAPPDKCWVCDDTGEVLPEWQLFGPSGRFDSVQWESPPTVTTMLRDQRAPVMLVHDYSTQKGTAGKSGNGAARPAAEGKVVEGKVEAADAAKTDAAKGDGHADKEVEKVNGEPAKGARARAGSTDQGLKAPAPIETTVKPAGGVS